MTLDIGNTMNPDTRAKYEALLAWISENAIKGGEFVKDQAPDVARQIVEWGFWSAMLGVALACFLLIAFLIAASIFWACGKRSYENRYKSGYEEFNYHVEKSDPEVVKAMLDRVGYVGHRDEFRIIAGVVLSIGLLLFLSVAGPNINTAVRCVVAPKVYLLEQLRVLK